MSALHEMDRASSQPGKRQPLRNPDEPIPKLALPTIGVYLTALTVFILSTTAGIAGWVWSGVTIAVNAVVIFVMFSVVHEAMHYLISSKRWVNALVGRLAWVFVTPMFSFPAYRFIHIAHHKYVNDDEDDPDAYASRAATWQLPFRWPAAELFYAIYYIRRLGSRPRAEYVETAVLFTLSTAGLTIATFTGNLWVLAALFLIPQRIAITLLGWWFNWLPHHGLEVMKRSNRYCAARVRVGMEWLFTPVMLSQNYHLVHHLHPSVPFYRCARMWRRNEEAYLQRNVAIATVFGQQLNSDDYREWKRLNRKLWRLLPVRRPRSDYAFIELSHHTDECVAVIQKYLDFLVQGDGRKAHCPFSRRMLEKRQFYYDTSDLPLHKEEFFRAIAAMREFHARQPDHLLVVGVAYLNEKNFSEAIAAEGEAWRQEIRPELISAGVTTAWTHPKNPIGTHTDRDKPAEPLWVSDIPLLMLRNLDKGDEPFMLSADSKRAFVLGMRYHETIPIEMRPAAISPSLEPLYKLDALVNLMEHVRLSSVRSVSADLGGNLMAVLKNGKTCVHAWSPKLAEWRGGSADA
jgi:fatty acid desaturase